ncbi:MAG: formate--tetrahydrofolate ligase [Gemmatimonadetes bacterium]|nr:formate--tetrahydrofolate ligase [Gemmatimonadota bacterium]MDA1103185.1 formate--tetrahydrofolate ligase [Gemmatimonadota bacterium]
MNTDLKIAQSAELRPISEIAAKLGLAPTDIVPYGHHKAKIPLEVVKAKGGETGHLVLVTGISPTPAGEGKSTVAVGLADALTLRRRNPVLCLREPSLGPVFGMKGGATGGGYSQVVPMEEINLHFTGDFHAITSAHALLSAVLDNHLFRPNTLNIDPTAITWPRAIDMNDRALRHIEVGLGGPKSGVPRKDGFVITAASEVMAIFCLADGLDDLKARLDRIIIGYTSDGEPIRAEGLGVSGAMTALLKDAMDPNLVQTLGGTPALVHGGPFANIAHGCNSLAATRAGLALGDVVVTEAGFGADLGAEKFFDIKCRFGNLRPGAAVVVATVRALKMNGGVAKEDLATESVEAVQRGFANLAGHVRNVRKFGVPPVVAINRFATDTEAEVAAVVEGCEALGVSAVVADPWGGGGSGCLDLADAVWAILESGEADYRPLYPNDLSLTAKIETIAREIYGADGVDVEEKAAAEIARLEAAGLGSFPVCVAKTQYSFSDDASLLGRPTGFRISVREVTASAGAGFVVAKTGSIMTMPGLGPEPSAMDVDVRDGVITGLF